MIKVLRMSPSAKLPTKAHSGDLGYDLYADENAIVYPGETMLIATGIAVQLPKGYGGFIKDRSSVATKMNLETVAGVIDNGYTGHIKVAMHNLNDHPVTLYSGEKIAQLVLIAVVDFEVAEVDTLESLDGRGEKGFGSTGT
jgi:dUTP pyrophosphatase